MLEGLRPQTQDVLDPSSQLVTDGYHWLAFLNQVVCIFHENGRKTEGGGLHIFTWNRAAHLLGQKKLVIFGHSFSPIF